MGEKPYLLEGDFIKTKEHMIFEVKGVEHPSDRVIAYLRYLPETLRESKVYEIPDRFEILKKIAPHYIYHPDWVDFQIQSVKFDDIIEIYKSNEVLQRILMESKSKEKKQKISSTLRKSIECIELLSSESKVDTKYFGITGSHLIGRENENSDIDIVVFGRINAKKVREFIRKCYNTKSNKIRPYTYPELKEHFKFRAKGSDLKLFQFMSSEVRKLHQGFYKNTEFFIRFFEYEDRNEYRKIYGNIERKKIISLGRVRIQASVRDDYSWWITPAEVIFGNVHKIEMLEKKSNFDEVLQEYQLSLKEIRCTHTIRGRYTENAKLLEDVIAEGNLELIILPNGEKYLQIYLGSHPNDKLFPI